MTLIACPQCAQEFDDEILCCPHCGTAQIPQLSKAELRLANMTASQGPLAAIYIGLAAGLLIGVVIFVIALLLDQASFALGLGIPLLGMLGSTLGFLIHRVFLSRHR